jgi:hypothetical protein
MNGEGATPNLNERVAELMRKVEYRQVLGSTEREDVYRLRYEAYLREGAIVPNVARRLYDSFDESENGTIFGIHIGGHLAGSIRIHVISRRFPTSPAMQVFGDYLMPLVEQGLTVIDSNRFVADYEASRRWPELPYIMVRIPYMAPSFHNADISTATVRAEHMAFYRKIFLCKPVCPPRPYPGLMKPLGLMTGEYQRSKISIEAKYPFFAFSTAELQLVFEPPNSVAHRPALQGGLADRS